jgi:hypothetical protein
MSEGLPRFCLDSQPDVVRSSAGLVVRRSQSFHHPRPVSSYSSTLPLRRAQREERRRRRHSSSFPPSDGGDLLRPCLRPSTVASRSCEDLASSSSSATATSAMTGGKTVKFALPHSVQPSSSTPASDSGTAVLPSCPYYFQLVPNSSSNSSTLRSLTICCPYYTNNFYCYPLPDAAATAAYIGAYYQQLHPGRLSLTLGRMEQLNSCLTAAEESVAGW